VCQVVKNQSGLLSSCFKLDEPFCELVVSAGISALNQGKDMTTITIQLIVVSFFAFAGDPHRR
jgi:hypothetical protein